MFVSSRSMVVYLRGSDTVFLCLGMISEMC